MGAHAGLIYYEVPGEGGASTYHTQDAISRATDVVVLGLATRILTKYRDPRQAYNAIRSARTPDNADAIQARVFQQLAREGKGLRREDLPANATIFKYKRDTDGEAQ